MSEESLIEAVEEVRRVARIARDYGDAERAAISDLLSGRPDASREVVGGVLSRVYTTLKNAGQREEAERLKRILTRLRDLYKGGTEKSSKEIGTELCGLADEILSAPPRSPKGYKKSWFMERTGLSGTTISTMMKGAGVAPAPRGAKNHQWTRDETEKVLRHIAHHAQDKNVRDSVETALTEIAAEITV